MYSRCFFSLGGRGTARKRIQWFSSAAARSSFCSQSVSRITCVGLGLSTRVRRLDTSRVAILLFSRRDRCFLHSDHFAGCGGNLFAVDRAGMVSDGPAAGVVAFGILRAGGGGYLSLQGFGAGA